MTSVEAPVKDFIQKIRECKTKAEERQMVAEASASIRTALKEGSEFRFRNMVRFSIVGAHRGIPERVLAPFPSLPRPVPWLLPTSV